MIEQNLHIGAQIHCQDGRCGRLAKLVVDPREGRVTNLIVEQGFLLKHHRVLSREWVERTTENDIFLNVGSDRLENCAEYREVEIKKSVSNGAVPTRSSGLAPGFDVVATAAPMVHRRLREGIVSGTIVLGDGTQIANLLKTVGHLEHVIVDGETGTITALVMHRGLIPERLLVPVEEVEELDDDYIRVRLMEEELKRLPRYLPRIDEQLQAEIEERLAASSDLVGVRADVQDSVVQLNGQVANPQVAQHVIELVTTVDGVTGVEHDLVIERGEITGDLPDGATSGAVEGTNGILSALMNDPRTRDSVIEVIQDRGTVTLQGRVTNAQIRRAAEEIVRAQPGVAVVHNELVFER